MAQVTLAHGIESVHGRFGGVYFKHSPDGQHIQAMPRAVRKSRMLYPRTFGESSKWSMGFGISAFTGMAGLWMLALLSFFGAAWVAYALVFWFFDRSGARKKISGYNWYMHYAMMFPEEDWFPFWKPPRAPNDLPEYIATYEGMWMYEHTPPEWPADCCGGFYYPGMVWNGEPSFRTDDYEWFLWWRGDVWVLSKSLGWEDPPTTFYSIDPGIRGYYKNTVTKKYGHVYFGKPQR